MGAGVPTPGGPALPCRAQIAEGDYEQLAAFVRAETMKRMTEILAEGEIRF